MEAEADIVEILRRAKTIAVVGCSPKPHRPSHAAARYLIEQGYRVVPINPAHHTLLDRKVYPDLVSAAESCGQIDIVDIFRAARHVRPHVEEAIEIGTRLIWMQLGVADETSARLARAAGIPVIMNDCLRVRHQALKGQGEL